MKNDLLISICIPAYNALKFIEETLDSIKHQEYDCWELIVVEDGSNDGTEGLIDQFRQSVSQNVVFFRNPINLGLPATRNVGASLSIGSWIAFLDSDDLWGSNHLLDLINTAKDNPDCELIHSGVQLFQSNTGKVTSVRFPGEDAIKDFPVSLFNRSYPIQPSAVMISRNLFNKTRGFCEDLRFVEDVEMWIRCARNGFKFAFTGKNSCLYRQHISGAITNNGLGMALGSATVFDMHSDWEEIPKAIRLRRASDQWFALSRITRKSDNQLARRSLTKAMRYNFRLKHILYWILFRIS